MQRPFIMRRAALLLLCLGLSGCFSPEEPRWYSDYIAEQEAQSNGGQNGAPDVTLDAGTPPSDTSPITDAPEPADTPAEPADTPELTDTPTADADVPGPECTPLCDDKICGDDGCGGSCGVCGDDEACVEGSCNPQECGICPIGTSCIDETASCEPGSCTTMLHKFLLEGAPNGLFHHYILYNLEAAYTAAWAQFGETPGDEAAVKEAVIVALSGDAVPETASLLALGPAEAKCLMDWSQMAVCAVGACGLGDSKSCTPETAQSDECIACIVTECGEFKPETGLSLNPGEYPDCHPTENVCGDAGEVCLETSEESCITLTCGVCDLGTLCSDAGQCEPGCEPSCEGKLCGSDGCGGECGDPCLPGSACVDGACIDAACAGLEDAYVDYNALEPGQVEALDWHQVYKQLTFHVLNRVGQECPASEPLDIEVLEECAVDAINYLETDDAYTLGVYGATTEGCLNCWADLSVQMQVSCNEPCWDIVTAEQTDAAVSDRCLQCLQQSLVVPEDGETTIASAFQACSGKDFITAGSEACFGGQCACESAEMDCLGPDACALLSDTLESFGLNPQESLDAALNATHSAAIACFTSGYSGYSAATCVSDLLNQGGEWAPPPALAQLVSTTTECLGCWGWLGEMMQEDCGADCAVFDAGCLDCMATPAAGNSMSGLALFEACSGISLSQPIPLCGDGLCELNTETVEGCPDDCSPYRAVLSVDMNCSEHAPDTPVYVMTSLTNPPWQVSVPMFDLNGSGIWTRSLAVANQGDAIEYKYLVEGDLQEDLLDNAAADEEVQDGGCVTGVDWVNGYASRKSPVIDGPMTLATDTFGQCVGCDEEPPNGTVGYLTLQIDLSPILPLPMGCDLGVHGTWAAPYWEPINSPTFENIGGSVYAVTLFVFHDATIDYQFFYDGAECQGADGANIVLESVEGQACMGGPDQVAHRGFTMPSSGDHIVDPVCWDSCAPCETSPAECNSDGFCDAALGETVDNCVDCAGQSACGDGICDDGENAEDCSVDCGTAEACGDGLCDPDESVTCPEDCCAGNCGGNTCGWDGCAGVCGGSCPDEELCVNGNCSDGGIANACDGVDQQLLNAYQMDLSGNLLQNTRNNAYSCVALLGEDATLDALVDCTAKANDGDSGGGTPNLHGYSSVEVSYDCLACWGELGVCVTSKCDDVCVNGEPTVACKECIADQCDFAECSGMSMFGTDCAPVCGGKDCGDDGCGGTCGECDLDETCGNGGVCTTPNCPPGLATCANTSSREVCSADGMTLTTEDCPAQSACLGGECVTCDGDPETQPAADPYACNPYCPSEVSCDDPADLCAVSGLDTTEACGVVTGAGEAGATCGESTDCLPGHVCDTNAGDPAVCRALCIDNSDCDPGVCSGSVSIGIDSVRTCESIACEPDCDALQESCGQDDGCGGVCSGCPEGEVCDPGSLTCVEDSPCQAFCSAMSATCDSEFSTQDWGAEGCLAACGAWPDSVTDNPSTLPYEHSLACRQHYLEAAEEALSAAEPHQGFCDLAGLYSQHCIDLSVIWPEAAQSPDACPEGAGPGSAECPYRLNAALLPDGITAFCDENEVAYELSLGLSASAAVPWSFTIHEEGPETFIAAEDGGPVDVLNDISAGAVSLERLIGIPHLPDKTLSFRFELTLNDCPFGGSGACTVQRDAHFQADFCPPRLSFVSPADDGVSVKANTADNLIVSVTGLEATQEMRIINGCNDAEMTISGGKAVRENETLFLQGTIPLSLPNSQCDLTFHATDSAGNETAVTRNVNIIPKSETVTCSVPSASCNDSTSKVCGAPSDSTGCGKDDGQGGVCPPCPIDCAQWYDDRPELQSGWFAIADGNGGRETVFCVQGAGFDGALLDEIGAGWTLLSVFADDGQDTWTMSAAELWESPTPVSSLEALNQGDLDYKLGPALLEVPLTELSFSHHANGPTVWLHYAPRAANGAVTFPQLMSAAKAPSSCDNGEGSPLVDAKRKDPDTEQVHSFEPANCDPTAESVCDSAAGAGQAECLCDSNLYFNAADHRGACDSCGTGIAAGGQHSVGPTWNVKSANGCDFDRPGRFGGLGPMNSQAGKEFRQLGFAGALGLNNGLSGPASDDADANNYHVRMYARRAVCGNSQVEAGEACDDGNRLDGDSCSADCAMSADCGDLTGVTHSFGDSVYAFCDQSAQVMSTWAEARDACATMGARLIRIESTAENAAISLFAQMFNASGDESRYWLGLNQRGLDPTSTAFHWDGALDTEDSTNAASPDGYFPSTFSTHSSDWSNSAFQAVYLETHPEGSNGIDYGLWHVKDDTEALPYICESL